MYIVGSGWTGVACQCQKDFCATPGPCKNGGTCQIVSQGYQCLCPMGKAIFTYCYY